MRILFAQTFLIFCFSLRTGFAQNWLTVSEGLDEFRTVFALYADTVEDGLYVGGRFEDIGNNAEIRSIGFLKDGQWHALANGLNSYQFPASVWGITKFNGELFACGTLTDANGLSCNGIAKWNGSQWSSVGDGLLDYNDNPASTSNVRVIDNQLYVCGRFVTAGNVTANGIAKWDGTSWSDVHNFPFFDVEGDVIQDCIMYNNELYVAGGFNGGATNGMLGIAKWNGNEWVGVGAVGTGQATCMAIYQDQLYVAGYFTSEMNPIFPGRHIVSWDGSNWDDVGGGLGNPTGTVHDMMVHGDKLYVVGAFSTAGGIPAVGIATWDGEEWCDLSSTSDNGIYAIERFQDTLYIGGAFTELNGQQIFSVAKSGGPSLDENCGTLSGIEHAVIGNFSELTIYPNPTTSTTTLTWQSHNHGSYQLTLYDVHGRQLLQHSGTATTGNNTLSIDMSAYAKGIYFGRLVVGEEMRSFKVVRE